MPSLKTNGIQLEYETLGRPQDPAVLLIMGLGAQLIDWPEDFCEQLRGHGFYVIRFDNRDAGLSTSLDELGIPDLSALLQGQTSAPYRLSDLACDAVGLLDALGIKRAHIVGASMGGMIAQQMGIDHPERVLSIACLMSTTGDPSVGQPTEAAVASMARPPANSREEAIERSVEAFRVSGSPAFPTGDEELRRRAATKFDRSYRPAAALRQYAAILASGDRTATLHSITAPTVVIHGSADPMIDPSGGRAIAEAIPGATLYIIEGMGHELPEGALPAITGAIARNAQRAGATA